MSPTRSLNRRLLVSSCMGGDVFLSLYFTLFYIKAALCCHHACFGAIVVKRKIAIREKIHREVRWLHGSLRSVCHFGAH